MLYKREHKETLNKTENEQIAIEKATVSQRHDNYYGFVKTGVRQQLHHL